MGFFDVQQVNYLPRFAIFSCRARDVLKCNLLALYSTTRRLLRVARSNHIMSAGNLCSYNYLDRRLLGGEASVPTWRKREKAHNGESHNQNIVLFNNKATASGQHALHIVCFSKASVKPQHFCWGAQYAVSGGSLLQFWIFNHMKLLDSNSK